MAIVPGKTLYINNINEKVKTDVLKKVRINIYLFIQIHIYIFPSRQP